MKPLNLNRSERNISLPLKKTEISKRSQSSLTGVLRLQDKFRLTLKLFGFLVFYDLSNCDNIDR